MSSGDTAISVRNLSKAYTIAHNAAKHTTLAEAMMHRLRNPFDRIPRETFWALRDLSLEIKRGEVVGIIGRNGAGKSTFLKILSRITEPTQGKIDLYGRVGSLLEVGTGFHPELTGRENIYLNGQILGMRKREIDRQFDAIVDFAEVDQFLDTPVKRYSSGMYVRLAFAVAAHLSSEILVVDEVLAVGDVAFQKKCLGKMQQVASGLGRTVLFVSHQMAAIRQLTNTCAVLRNGSLGFYGNTTEAIERYMQWATQDLTAAGRSADQLPRRYTDLSRDVEFVSVEIDGHPSTAIPADEDLVLRIAVRGRQATPRFRFSMTIFRSDGTPVGSMFARDVDGVQKGELAQYRLVLHDLRLAPGSYFFGLATGVGDHQTGHRDFDVLLDVLSFTVMAPTGDRGTVSHWTEGWGTIRFVPPTVTRLDGSCQLIGQSGAA